MPSYDLPLFPLNTVLFPGQMLPLHIFEPRYRQMVADCMAGDQTFGVVLIREGYEVGAPATPYAIGTSAVIQEIERLPDGRMNIVTVGQERFRTEEYAAQKPYLVGRVSPWPWEQAPIPGLRLRQSVQERLERYAGLLARVSDSEIQLDPLPQDPAVVALLAAGMLRLPPAQKQALLEIPSIEELLRYLQQLLGQENRALEVMAAVLDQRAEMAGPFSDN